MTGSARLLLIQPTPPEEPTLPRTPDFTLDLDTLRAVGRWAAASARAVLPLFEAAAPGDNRPREALDGLDAFVAGGRRTAHLRTLCWAAYAAAREVKDPAASAAAYAALSAASSAYTHPLADVTQTKHVVGAAGYAAWALELAGQSADAEVASAVAYAPPEVVDLLRKMHPRSPGKSRLDRLLWAVDAGGRAERQA